MKNFSQKIKNSNIVLLIVFLVLLALGIVLLLDLVGVINNHQGWDKIEATVSQFDKSRDLCSVTYIYKGIEYKNVSLGSYSSSYHVGMKVEIFVNPNNPNQILSAANDIKIAKIFGCAFCLALGIFGPFVLTCNMLNKRHYSKVNALCENLQTENVETTSASMTYTVKQINYNRSNYQMIDSKGTVVFECEKVGYNPFKGRSIRFKNKETGETFELYAGNTVSVSHPKDAESFTSSHSVMLGGTDVWTFCQKNNLSLSGVIPNYILSYKGVPVARIDVTNDEILSIGSKDIKQIAKGMKSHFSRKDIKVECAPEFIKYGFFGAFIIVAARLDSMIS